MPTLSMDAVALPRLACASETGYRTLQTGAQAGWPPQLTAWQTSPRLQSLFWVQGAGGLSIHDWLAMQNCPPPTAVSQKHCSNWSSVGSVACAHLVSGQTHCLSRQA